MFGLKESDANKKSEVSSGGYYYLWQDEVNPAISII